MARYTVMITEAIDFQTEVEADSDHEARAEAERRHRSGETTRLDATIISVEAEEIT